MTYQDYILRHIQQASRACARIVLLIKDRQFETAHMVLDQAYRQLIGSIAGGRARAQPE